VLEDEDAHQALFISRPWKVVLRSTPPRVERRRHEHHRQREGEHLHRRHDEAANAVQGVRRRHRPEHAQGALRSQRAGDKFDSWISKGENIPASAEDIKAALGDRLDRIAGFFGGDKDKAADETAEVLPDMVDRMTPDGTIPSGS
jgi:uncharacterized protein YidB (DUF937 family)